MLPFVSRRAYESALRMAEAQREELLTARAMLSGALRRLDLVVAGRNRELEAERERYERLVTTFLTGGRGAAQAPARSDGEKRPLRTRPNLDGEIARLERESAELAAKLMRDGVKFPALDPVPGMTPDEPEAAAAS